MPDRTIPLSWGWEAELKPCPKRKRAQGKFKCTPELASKGKFIREGVTLHRKSVVSSQRQRLRESEGIERNTERKKSRKNRQDLWTLLD